MFDIGTDRRARRWGRLVAAPVGVIALVGLAACGTGTDTSSASGAAATTAAPSSAAPGATNDRRAELTAYRTCLEQNGVTLPSRQMQPPGDGQGGQGGQGQGGTPPSGEPRPGGGMGMRSDQPPPGVDAATWTKAQQACASLRPTRGPRPSEAPAS